MPLNIPMPGLGSGAFQSGAETGSNMMNRIIQNMLTRQQQQETAQYHKGSLDISRGNLGVAQHQENRMQQLLKSQLQQYADAHKMAATKQWLEDYYNNAIKNYKPGQPGGQPGMPQGMPGTESAGITGMPMFQQPEQGYTPIPTEQAGMSGVPMYQKPDEGFTPINTPMNQFNDQLTQMMKSQPMQVNRPRAPSRDQVAEVLSQLGMGQDMQINRPAIQRTEMGQPGQQPGVSQEAAAPKEIVLRAGNPALEALDADPRKIKTSYAKGGTPILTYPSGKIVAVPLPPGAAGTNIETPEQKRAGMLANKKEEIAFSEDYKVKRAEQAEKDKEALAVKKAELKVAANKKAVQEKADTKESAELIGAGRLVQHYAPNLEKIDTLLKGKNGKNMTGNFAAAKYAANLGTQEQGEFTEAINPLIGQRSKELSKQGGAYVSKLASSGKPGRWQSPETNIGLNKGLIEESINTYDTAKNRYEQLTGKKYPIEMPPFLKRMQGEQVISVKNNAGQIQKIYRKNLNEAKKLDSSIEEVK